MIGQKKTKIFWHQSEARITPTVWNWSVKTLSPGALIFVLDFSSPEFFLACLDFSLPPLTAPGSPRMGFTRILLSALQGGGQMRDPGNEVGPLFQTLFNSYESNVLCHKLCQVIQHFQNLQRVSERKLRSFLRSMFSK